MEEETGHARSMPPPSGLCERLHQATLGLAAPTAAAATAAHLGRAGGLVLANVVVSCDNNSSLK